MIDVHQLADFSRRLKDARGGLRHDMMATADGVTRLVAAKAAALAPHFEGHLKNSIANEVLNRSDYVEGHVYAQVAYAMVQEYGRRPGRWPPVEPIRRWVELKLAKRSGAIGEHDIDRVTFLIRRKIGTHGTKGHRYFARALSALSRRIDALLGELLTQLENRL